MILDNLGLTQEVGRCWQKCDQLGLTAWVGRALVSVTGGQSQAEILLTLRAFCAGVSSEYRRFTTKNGLFATYRK